MTEDQFRRPKTEDRRPKTEEKYLAPYGAFRSGVAIKDGLRPSLNHYSAYGLILPQKSSRSKSPVWA